MKRAHWEIIGIVVTLLLLAAIVFWLVDAVVRDMNNLLCYAGLVVAAATMASIVFAVITYLESVVLRSRVRELGNDWRQELQDTEKKWHRLDDLYREQYYMLAIASYSICHEMAILSKLDSDAYAQLVSRMKPALIAMHLTRGSPVSIANAIQEAAKGSKEGFLEIEGRVWGATERLSVQEKAELRKMYSGHKRVVLARMVTSGLHNSGMDDPSV